MDKEISPTEAYELKKNNPDTLLLDVREDAELEICRIGGALHVPMGQIGEHHEKLPKGVFLVVFCHHGMRSMSVVQFLSTKGFDKAINMAGGIHAWQQEVDPSLATY